MTANKKELTFPEFVAEVLGLKIVKVEVSSGESKDEKAAPEVEKARNGEPIVRDELYVTDNGNKTKIIYIDESEDMKFLGLEDDGIETCWYSANELYSKYKEPTPKKPCVALNIWIKHAGEVRPVEIGDKSIISLVTKEGQMNEVTGSSWYWKQDSSNPIICYKIHSL